MSYLLLILYYLALSYWVYRSRFFAIQGKPNWLAWVLFSAKFLGGSLVYFVYEYYYQSRHSSDIFKYFDDGNIIFSAFAQNPIDYFKMVTGIKSSDPHLIKYYDTCYFWFKEFNYSLINDNRIVIRFNAIIRLISMGNIHIHTLFFSFISFTGFWAILKTFEPLFRNIFFVFTALVFFLPSAFFWTSGMLKEAILMFALGWFVFSIRKISFNPHQIWGWIIMILSVLILLLSKFYVLAAAVPAISFLALTRFGYKKAIFLQFIAIHMGVLILFSASQLLIGIDMPEVLVKKQNDFIKYTNSLEHVGSQIELEPLQPGILNLLEQSPKALATVFFRPTLFESNNPMMLMAALENAFILIIVLMAIFLMNKKSVSNPIFWALLSFVFILFTLSGITTPVLGALVRYKAPALPFLGIALLMILDNQKLIQILNRSIKWIKSR